LRELTKFDPENNVTGVLFGTTEALRVDMALARFASSPIRGAGRLQSLADVGITVNDDGTLSFDENRFAAKFNADAQAVRQFFTTEELGLAARLNATIERLAGAGNSLLVNRNQTLQRQIELNNSRIDTLNKRLDREREALLAQFLRLETLVSRMQNSLNALSNLQAVPPPVARNR
jgi:flagellar hook-associated protein 2